MIATPIPPAVVLKPSRTRHLVLLFAASLAVITYVDRVCMSQAKGSIQTDLHLTDSEMGYVFFAFIAAYALFEIPGGWLGDLIGPRKVLLRVVTLWSFFTAATGWVWNLPSLIVTQSLFGAGEAGAFPNLAKAYTNWLPPRERTRAVSIMWVCTRWGGAITPLLVVAVIYLVGWRWAFGVFALPGIVWAAIFFAWFRDHPRDHPAVNAAELALIDESRTPASARANVPWSRIIRSRTVWLLFIQYFCFGYGWYFYITWLPTYVSEVHGADFKTSPLLNWIPNLLGPSFPAVLIPKIQAALLAGIPLFFGGFACILSTWLAGWLVRRGFRVIIVRRTLACIAYWGAAIMLLLSTRIADPVPAMLAMGLASFFLDLTLPICWRTAMDVGGKCAGTISGTMNMAGQIGGALGPIVVGYILQFMHRNWTLTFAISAIIYVLGGLCWLLIDPVTPIDADPSPSPTPQPHA